MVKGINTPEHYVSIANDGKPLIVFWLRSFKQAALGWKRLGKKIREKDQEFAVIEEIKAKYGNDPRFERR